MNSLSVRKDETQKRWGRARRLHGKRQGIGVRRVPKRHAPNNKAFYETMFRVKDFWATPEYAELLIQMNQTHLSLRDGRPGVQRGGARRSRQGLATRPSRSTAANNERHGVGARLPPALQLGTGQGSRRTRAALRQ